MTVVRHKETGTTWDVGDTGGGHVELWRTDEDEVITVAADVLLDDFFQIDPPPLCLQRRQPDALDFAIRLDGLRATVITALELLTEGRTKDAERLLRKGYWIELEADTEGCL